MKITTRKLKATDTLGERVCATQDNGGTITRGYDYGLNPEDAHRKVAGELTGRSPLSMTLVEVTPTGYIFETD